MHNSTYAHASRLSFISPRFGANEARTHAHTNTHTHTHTHTHKHTNTQTNKHTNKIEKTEEMKKRKLTF